MNVFAILGVIIGALLIVVLFTACRAGGQADDLTEKMTGRRMS